MEITLNVNVNLSPRLEALLGQLAGSIARVPDKPVSPAPAAPAAPAAPEPIVAFPVPETSATSANVAPAAPEPAPQDVPFEPETSDETIKAAMADTFVRIVGKDWRTTGDAAKKRLIVGIKRIFLQIAAAAQEGCQKPTALEGHERRQKFCMELQNIGVRVGEDGQPIDVEWTPF